MYWLSVAAIIVVIGLAGGVAYDVPDPSQGTPTVGARQVLDIMA